MITKTRSIFPILALAAVLTSGLPASADSSIDPDLLIIRGIEVPPADPVATTTVAILNQSQGEISLCSGSIVAPDLVVTAGHCVGPERTGMRLVFTTDIRKPGARVVAVAGYVRPKNYGRMVNEQDMDDIALIRFEGGLPPGYGVARLLDDPSALKNGEKVTLAGYGVTNGHPSTDPSMAGAGVLRKVDVTIAQAAYGKTEVVMDQSHGHGACHGDSGGPAFLKRGGDYLLFGVTSRGTAVGAEECAGASIYTSILAQGQFLREAADGLRRGLSMP
jgi:hypothetical protein